MKWKIDFEKPIYALLGAFVALRCFNVIDWPILWVLSPLWIGGTIGLFLTVMVAYFREE